MIEIELIPEPKVEFADNFLCDDPKTGIAARGFYSLSNNSHNSEIHYAAIGTQNNVEALNEWILTLKNRIESSTKTIKIKNEALIDDGEVLNLFSDEEDSESAEDEESETNKEDKYSEQNKRLNPDFPGFDKETCFKCEFLNDQTNNLFIKKANIDEILKSSDNSLYEKSQQVVNQYVSAYADLIENSFNNPDICFIVIPSEVFKLLGSITYGKQKINFRRKLKAAILSLQDGKIPVQLILEDTIKDKKKSMQDKSMIAWNFVVAQYYKTTNSIPWLLTDIDKNSCFVGISFHKILNSENNLMRSSVAQAFNREGKGLIFVGKQFEWNTAITKVSTPHLKYEYAKELISNVLINYQKVNKHTPTRVVIHKTTDFWDYYINEDYAEIEGLLDGIKETLNSDVNVDLVTIKTSKIKLLRTNGIYPVIRGTLMKIDDYAGLLYTTGYIPYYQTFPGMHIPLGLDISIAHGETTLRNVCREILALTKLNFNNCNYYDSLPITLRFAQKVGEIIQYMPEGVEPPNRYYYYM